MAANRLVTALRQMFARGAGLPQESLQEREEQTPAWQAAQHYEREFWLRLLREELQITARDQLVGFRLCEGRLHLCQFGLEWDNWLYTGHPPGIAGKVLDVGSSVVSVFEKCRSVAVVAIDPALEQLLGELPGIVVIGKINNCEYRSCRIQEVRETDFDVVWCNNVLDHTAEWQAMLSHFPRVLKHSGLLFLGTDVRRDATLLDVGHIAAFTAPELLAEVVAQGFEVLWQSPVLDVPQYRFYLRAVKR
jgi:2-polyprenyl-3-methyl-5-hydroxy-6-metoxy-1,4-benzoquinol methylase